MLEKKILIVEDEIQIGKLLKMYLEREKYVIELEANGLVGLMKALNQRYDLIILDILMPGMDGFEVLDRLRQEKNTPVIMLSAKGEEQDIQRGLELGANHYLTKPFSCNDVVLKVKQLID